VRLSNKIVGLDLAPFSEKVERITDVTVLCNVFTPTRKTLDFEHAEKRKTWIHERRRGYIHL